MSEAIITFTGEKKRLDKYQNTKYLGVQIGFVRLTKQASYVEDNIVEKAWIELYGLDDKLVVSISTYADVVSEHYWADALLHLVQYGENLDVSK